MGHGGEITARRGAGARGVERHVAAVTPPEKGVIQQTWDVLLKG